MSAMTRTALGVIQNEPKRYEVLFGGVYFPDGPDHETSGQAILDLLKTSYLPLQARLSEVPSRFATLRYAVARTQFDARVSFQEALSDFSRWQNPLTFAKAKSSEASSPKCLQDFGVKFGLDEEVSLWMWRALLDWAERLHVPSNRLMWLAEVLSLTRTNESKSIQYNIHQWGGTSSLCELVAEGSAITALPPSVVGILWEKHAEVFGSLSPHEVRWGDHRRLIDAARALKVRRVRGRFPLRLAIRVGRMPLLTRIIASQIVYDEVLPREEAETKFWSDLTAATAQPALFAWKWAKRDGWRSSKELYTFIALLTEQSYRDLSWKVDVRMYLPPPFSDETTRKAWEVADDNARTWVVGVCGGDVNLARLVLATPCIPYMEQAEKMLLRLPPATWQHLIRQTIYFYQGEALLVTCSMLIEVARMWYYCRDREPHATEMHAIHIHDWYGWGEDLATIIIRHKEADPAATPILHPA